MASNADFTIDADPFANLGFDALASQVLTLQLEDTPALDVRSTVYKVIAQSFGAADIPELGGPLGAGASPTPTPGSGLDVTIPATPTASYIIQCKINGGKNTLGETVASFTKQRLVAVRNTAGLRKIAPSESTQYDATHGWTEALAALVDAVAAVASYAVAGVPSAAPSGQQAIITDEVIGFPVLAYSDGTDWRRVTDGAVISV